MSVQKDPGDLNKVWEVKPLKKKPGDDEARRILENVAKQVQPIMHKRGWRVKMLSEFYPKNPCLLGLNVNRGVEVKLRLRRHNRELDFFPYEQILDTMLHELCHNRIGPHNADFYKLLDELRAECEQLMAKGVTGTAQRFDLPGRRLGGFSRQPPMSELRQTALSAAQKRAQRASSLPSGPQRVGGDSSIKDALSPIQAAAMAAERRLHDDLWCGSMSIGEGQEESCHPGEASSSHSKRQRTTNSSTEFIEIVDEWVSSSTWQCGACTLNNKAMAPVCEVCEAPRPEERSERFKHWLCKFCTLKNQVGVDKCLACGEWRYSHGPPVTSFCPFPGT